MKVYYYTLAGVATVLGGCLLALQIVGGLEYTAGSSLYTQASMVAAMITVAILPVVIDAAWRTSRFLSVCLVLGFIAFLAYSLPANIGRIGEIKEGKALAANDAAGITSQITSINATLRYAEPDALAECQGAPVPLPSNGWPNCRRKQATVTALTNDRARLQSELRGMGTARLGDTSSTTLAWALAGVGITEQTIRRGSGMAFAVGHEIVIASLLALAAAAVRRALTAIPAHSGTLSRQSGNQWQIKSPVAVPDDEPDAPSVATPKRQALSRDEAIADLKALLQAGHEPPSQDWLTERWGVTKSCTSKWLRHIEETGALPGNRVVQGRCKTVVSA